MPRRKPQLMMRKISRDRESCSINPKAIKQEPNCTLDLLVGVEHECATVEDVSRGRRTRALSFLSFVDPSTLKSKLHQMPFGIAHCPLHAKYQPVVEIVGIVYPVIVDDQRI